MRTSSGFILLVKAWISGSSSGRIGPDEQPLAAMGDLGFELDRIGPDGKARSALLPRRLAHDNTGVERDHAVGIGQQRVDIELGDLAHVGDELRQPHQDVADGAARGTGGRSR